MRLSSRAVIPLICALWLALPAGSGAVAPPGPGVKTPAGFGKFVSRQNRLYRSVAARRADVAPALAAAVQPAMRLPVIMAAYADMPGVITPAVLEQRLFGEFDSGSMRDYYTEVSLGRFSLEGDIHGWLAVPRTREQYTAAGPLGNGGVFPDTPEGYVVDAVRAADLAVDFSLYDNDGPDGVPNSGDDDGLVDALVVVHPGGDAALGADDNIWSHSSRLGTRAVETDDPSASGGFIRVDSYSLVPELAGDGSSAVAADIGVFCHEFAHQLGLVDLYDTDDSDGADSHGIGVWGLMGYGTYGADGRSAHMPTHPCAWSMLRLGWAVPAFEDSSGLLALEPVGESGRVVRAWDNPDHDLSYFLLSCRARSGFDRMLPGEGLLIWHVDERAFDNDNPAFKLVDLEAADGAGHLDLMENTGDAGDPFPGSSGNSSFTALTSPSSARNDGSASGVSVTDISFDGATARFRLGRAPAGRITLHYDEHGPREDRGFGYGGDLAHGAVVFTAPQDGVLEEISTYLIYNNMSYTLELYAGQDSGRLHCPAVFRQGEADSAGWVGIGLDPKISLAAGDTIIAVVGYRTSGFDDGWPVPHDPTGEPAGRSMVSFSGLGRFEPHEHDISIRAKMRPGLADEDALVLEPGLDAGRQTVYLERAYAGESYAMCLPLYNPGGRRTVVEDVLIEGPASFSAPERSFILGCNSVKPLPITFTPVEPGLAEGRITLRPLGLPVLSAGLIAETRGWSVRYDSTGTPGGYDSSAESATGAVRFTMPRGAVLNGVRTFALQDSMYASLRIWSGARNSRGHCLVAESSADTLLMASGWHQVFLPAPVVIDSMDTFVAEVEYTAPGRAYSELVPVDTMRVSATESWYNFRSAQPWLPSEHPVVIRALIESGVNWQEGQTVRKQALAGVSRESIAFSGLTVGEEAVDTLWLHNRGTSTMRAALDAESSKDSTVFGLSADSLTIGCADSAMLLVRCLALSPGSAAGVLRLTYDADGEQALSVPLAADADRFVLRLDENGYTASAGYNDSAAVGAVLLETPWAGTLGAVQVYVNEPGMRLSARAWLAPAAPPQWEDSVTIIWSWTDQGGGSWNTIRADTLISFAAGDSFALEAAFVSPGGATMLPLPIDHRGEPSGSSWAAPDPGGPWEPLSYDLVLRAVMYAEETVAEGYPVSGLLLDERGGGLAAELVLRGGSKVYRTRSDSSGAFIFGSVPAGSYTLRADPAGYSVDERAIELEGPLHGLRLDAFPGVRGDLDSSGRTDVLDLIHLLRILAGTAPAVAEADLDSSGRVDIFDLIRLLSLLSG